MAAPFQLMFSDLDGTLLDERTYAFEAAVPALRALQASRITLVLCTSKTFAETVVLQQTMGFSGPCIVENGGAVYFPRDLPLAGSHPLVRCGDWDRLDLGLSYDTVVQGLEGLQRMTGIRVRGFSGMAIPEIAEACGLTLEAAGRCKHRAFDEPFVLGDASPGDLARLAHQAREMGLTLSTGGRFHHLSAGSDKGRAVRLVCECLAPSDPSIRTAGVGDSPNDLPMLEAVDVPVLVMRPEGAHHPGLVDRLPHAIRAPGVGPIGWNLAVLELLGREVLDES